MIAALTEVSMPRRRTRSAVSACQSQCSALREASEALRWKPPAKTWLWMFWTQK